MEVSPAYKATQVPQTPFRIQLKEGRIISVLDYIDENHSVFDSSIINDPWNFSYLCTGIRHWTSNGEHADKSLILSLIRGSEKLLKSRPNGYVDFDEADYLALES